MHAQAEKACHQLVFSKALLLFILVSPAIVKMIPEQLHCSHD